MNIKWKVVWMLIIVTMMFGVFGGSIYAEEDETAEVVDRTSEQVIVEKESYSNPLYEEIFEDINSVEYRDVISVMSLEESDESDENEAIEYLSSIEDAGTIIREAMKSREEVVVVYFVAEEYSRDLLVEISEQALIHTGNPTEGDYLMWQYGGWNTSTSYYTEDDMCYMTIEYTYIYYTTSEQEAVIDQRVSELIEEMELEGKSEYEKTYLVYQYICENVTYDNENVDDESYTLKFSAYAALVDETAVCQGIAVLYYRMMLELGIDCRAITGTSSSGGAHGWNIVELYGEYYNVDATWDLGKDSYEYFLKSEENFSGHIRDEVYTTEEFNVTYNMADADYDNSTTIKIEEPVITSLYTQVQDSVKVSWSTVDMADGYQLWRSMSPDGSEEEWELVKTITSGEIVQYTNSGLEIGQTYYYKIRAYMDDGGTRYYSEYSDVHYMPAAVVFDTIYSNSTERIRILWNEVEGAQGYQIWRVNEDGSYGIVKILDGEDSLLTDAWRGTLYYSNTGLVSGDSYSYYMRAYSIIDGTVIYGAYSDEIEVCVMPESPSLSLSQSKTDRISLIWNYVNGAVGYQIWRADSETGTFSIVKVISDSEITTYTNTGLNEGTTYYYKIRACTEVDGAIAYGEFSEVQSNN